MKKNYIALIFNNGYSLKTTFKRFIELKKFLKESIIEQLLFDPLYEKKMQELVEKINKTFENIMFFKDLKNLEIFDKDNFVFYYNDQIDQFVFKDLDNDYKLEIIKI